MYFRNMKMPKEIYLRWIGIVVLGFIISFFVKDQHNRFMINNVLITIIFTAVFWNGAYFIMLFFRKRFPGIRQTATRLLFTVVTISVFLLTAETPLRLIFRFVTWEELINPAILFEHSMINFIAALIVTSLYESSYFFGRWKEAIRANEQLRNQQIKTQFEVLQNQMSPHFLFNSLNTLTALIAENPSIAIEFTQRLSEVYRYILRNKERELVALEDEIDFVKDYIFLLKMRYPENLNVDFDINTDTHRMHIAPLTLQMLVENAIKHNVISKANPLNISIYVENGKSIVVKNNLMKKNSLEGGTKTGLENIRKRYEYLGHQSIDIITSAKNFMVAVPLLDVIQEQDYTAAIES